MESFMELPADVLLTVCQVLSVADVARLERTSSAVREFLLRVSGRLRKFDEAVVTVAWRCTKVTFFGRNCHYKPNVEFKQQYSKKIQPTPSPCPSEKWPHPYLGRSMFFLPTTLSPAETLLDLQKFVLRRMIIKRVSVSRADGSVIEALAKVLEGYQLEKLTVEETAVTEELLLSHLRHHHRISEALLLRLVSATRPKCFKLSAPTLPLSKSFFLHPVIQSDVQDLDLNVCWIHHSSYSEMAVTSYCSPDLSEFDDATLLTLRKEHLSLKLRTHMTLQGLNAFGKHFLANPEMRSAYLSFDTTQPIWLSEGRFIRIPRTVWPRNNERVISHKEDLITENGEEYEVSLLDGTCFMPIPSTLISYTIIFRYKDV